MVYNGAMQFRILIYVCIAFSCSFFFAHAQSSVFRAQEADILRVEKLLKLPEGFLAKNYTATFQVDAGPSAPVIVHIGQVHEDYRGAEYSQKARGEILHNQTRIQQLILELVKKNTIGCVFAEGFAQKSPEALFAVRERREALVKAIDLRATQSRSFYVKDIEVFEPFVSRIKSYRQYNDAEIQVKVYEAIVGYLEKHELSSADASTVTRARAQLNTLYAKYGKYPSVLMSGAVNKLFFEHKIPAVCPAEDLDVNLRAQEVMKRANQLTDRANAADIKKAMNEQERIVIGERDAAVQTLIRTIPKRYKSKVVVAVFGDAHDWTAATITANTQSKAVRYSYIKITPKPGSTW